MITIALEPIAQASEKQCRTCREVKPVREFWKMQRNSDGFSHTCLACGVKLRQEKKAAPKRIRKPVPPAAAPQSAEPELFSELKALAKRFILNYLAHHGEACDLFFQHRIQYEHPDVHSEAIERSITGLIRENKVKVARWEAYDLKRVNFLALA